MGCVTMTQNFFGDGIISRERVDSGILSAKTELEPHAMRYKWLGWEKAIGASGSIRAVHKVLLAQNPAQTTIKLKALHDLLNQTIELGSIENLQLPGLNPERAPVFIGGLIVLTATFEALDIDEMEVSDRALREGLLHDLLGRHTDADIRDSSVENLARRYHADEEHSSRIINTARNFFHQAAPKLSLDEESEQWLIWAAQLHEIGLDIAHNRHHHHAAYIIEHSDLAGFSQQEQQLLAALVRSHRRKVPTKLFKDLPKRLGKPAKRLVLLLRLAVIMHRNRSKSSLPDIKLNVDGKNIQLTFPKDWLNEQALTQADLIQEQQYLSSLGFTLSLL